MMTLTGETFPPLLLCHLFFSLKERKKEKKKKSHTGIRNLVLAIGKMKFKSKQGEEIVREQLHYLHYWPNAQNSCKGLRPHSPGCLMYLPTGPSGRSS